MCCLTQNLCQTHSLEALLITTCKNGRTLTISGHQEHGDFDHSISIDGDGEDEGKEKMKDLVRCFTLPRFFYGYNLRFCFLWGEEDEGCFLIVITVRYI